MAASAIYTEIFPTTDSTTYRLFQVYDEGSTDAGSYIDMNFRWNITQTINGVMVDIDESILTAGEITFYIGGEQCESG